MTSYLNMSNGWKAVSDDGIKSHRYKYVVLEITGKDYIFDNWNVIIHNNSKLLNDFCMNDLLDSEQIIHEEEISSILFENIDINENYIDNIKDE